MKKKLKIFKVFKILTLHDLVSIKKMLQSPFFKVKKDLELLFDVLESQLPEFESRTFNEQVVHLAVYPGINYPSVKFRNLCSDLVKLIEDYLIFKEMKRSKTERELALLEIYLKRNAEELYLLTEKKLMKNRINSHYDDVIFNKRASQLNQIRLDEIGSSDFLKRMDLLHDSYLLNETTYLLKKRKIEIELISIKNMTSDSIEIPDFDPRTSNILLRIYDQFDVMYASKTIAEILKTKELIFSNLSTLRQSEVLKVYIDIINFGVRMMRFDDKKYTTVVFGLYESGIEEGIFIENGKMTTAAFFNVTAMGLKVGKLEWVREFVLNHEQYLPSNERKGIKNYSLAQIYFFEKKFEEILEVLKEVKKMKFKHPTIRVMARLIELRAGYEYFLINENYDVQLDKNIKAFEKWNYRNKAQKNYIAVTNFISILRKLLTDTIDGKLSEKKRQGLLKRLNDSKEVVSRQWLFEKIKSTAV